MAKQTKISSELQEKLNNMGINAKNEEQAKAKLIEILEDNGIEGMEEEDLETLIDIAESFVDEAEPAEEVEETEEEEQPEEEEAEALAEEAAEEEEPEEQPEEEEPEEEPEEEGDEFDEMDRKELKDYIKEHGYEIKVTKSMSDDDVRDEIRNAVADEEAKKAAAKKAPKKVEKKAEVKKEAKKEEKKVPAKKTSSKQVLSPKTNEEDKKHFDFLKELYPEGEYEYAWVTSGVSIKHIGKNNKRVFIALKHCTLVNGVMKCSVYLPLLCKKTELLDNAGFEYQTGIMGDPYMNAVMLDDNFFEAIKEINSYMLEIVTRTDKKLGENRKKMEEELEKKAKPAAKQPEKKAAPAKKEVAKEPEKPAKKAEKKTTKK